MVLASATEREAFERANERPLIELGILPAHRPEHRQWWLDLHREFGDHIWNFRMAELKQYARNATGKSESTAMRIGLWLSEHRDVSQLATGVALDEPKLFFMPLLRKYFYDQEGEKLPLEPAPYQRNPTDFHRFFRDLLAETVVLFPQNGVVDHALLKTFGRSIVELTICHLLAILTRDSRPGYIHAHRAKDFDPLDWAEQQNLDVRHVVGDALAELRYRLLRQCRHCESFLDPQRQREATITYLALLRQVPTTRVDNVLAFRRTLGLPATTAKADSSKHWTTEEFRWLCDSMRGYG